MAANHFREVQEVRRCVAQATRELDRAYDILSTVLTDLGGGLVDETTDVVEGEEVTIRQWVFDGEGKAHGGEGA